MATSLSENFEKTGLHEFESITPLTTANGVKLMQRSFLKKGSGIRAATSPKNADSKELVLAPFCTLYLEFPGGTKNLSFDYHVTLENSYRGLIDRAAAEQGQRPNDLVKESLPKVAKMRFLVSDEIKERVLCGTLDTLTFKPDLGTLHSVEITTLTQHEVRLEVIRWDKP